MKTKLIKNRVVTVAMPYEAWKRLKQLVLLEPDGTTLSMLLKQLVDDRWRNSRPMRGPLPEWAKETKA